MTEIDRLNVALSGDAGGLRRELHGANDALDGFLKRSLSTAAGVTAAFAGMDVISKVFQAGKNSAIGFNAELEQSRVGWTTMLGSAQAAGVYMGQLQQFAAQTPFEFPELQRSAQLMMGMGFSARDIIPILTDVGNALSAMGNMGKGQVDAVTRAMGQMQLAGRVNAQDMNQLTNAMIPGWDILAKHMGVTVAQVRKMSEEGQISSKVFLEAFRTWSQARFGGAMEEQAKTFNGAMSTIRDVLNQFGATALEPLFKRLSDVAVRFSQFAQTDDFSKWAGRIAARVEVVLDGLGKLTGAFTKTLNSILSTVLGTGLKVYEALQWLNPFARHSDPLVDSVEKGIDMILAKYRELDGVSDDLSGVASAMENLKTVSAAAMAAFKEADLADQMERVAKFGNDVAEAYGQAIEEVSKLAPILRDLKGEIKDQEERVKEAKSAVDEHSKSMRAQEQVIRDGEIAGRGYRDSIRDVERELVPLQDAAERAKDALADKRREVDAGRDALSRLRDELSATKDDMDKFTRAPVAGERVFREAMGKIDDQIRGVELNLAKLGPRASESQKKGLQAQLEELRRQKDILRLEREKVTAPVTRQREIAVLPEEMAGSDITAGVLDAAQKMSRLEKEEKAATVAQHALEQSTRPLEKAHKDAADAVEGQQRKLRDLRNEYRDYLAKEVEPAKVALEEMRLEHVGFTQAYDDEREKLGTLREAYEAVRDTAKEWNDSLKDVLQSADDVIQKEKEAERERKSREAEAKKAAKEAALTAGGTGPSEDEKRAIPDLEAGVAKLKKAREDFETEMGAFQTQAAPVLSAFGKVVDFLNSDFFQSMVKAAAMVAGVTVAFRGLLLIVGAVSSPIGAAILAITALSTAWETNVLHFRTLGIEVFERDIPAALELFSKAWKALMEGDVPTAMDSAAEGVNVGTQGIRDHLKWLLDEYVMPWLSEFASNVGRKVKDEWVPAFLTWLVEDLIPIEMPKALTSLLTAVITWIGKDETTKGIDEAFFKWATVFAGDVGGWLIGTALPRLMVALAFWLAQTVKWAVVDAPPLIALAFANIGIAMINGIMAGLAELAPKLIKWLNDMFKEWGIPLEIGGGEMKLTAPRIPSLGPDLFGGQPGQAAQATGLSGAEIGAIMERTRTQTMQSQIDTQAVLEQAMANMAATQLAAAGKSDLTIDVDVYNSGYIGPGSEAALVRAGMQAAEDEARNVGYVP